MARRRLDRTLTIRLDSKSARALSERASAQRRSASDLVRALIEDEVLGPGQGPSAMDLSARYVGAIKAGPVAQGRKARERLRGWDPDRRG
jgi:plasmid stability protein